MKPFPFAARLTHAALAAALLAPAFALAQNIAIVNGKPVPKARADVLLQQIAQQAQSQGQPLPADAERQVRDEVVLREIFIQEAERRGLPATTTYKQQMENARASILLRELQKDFETKNPVSDADIQAEYDKFKAQSGGKEFKTRHILVETEDEAKALIAKIKAGADFAETATASSKDPGSAPNGGDLDWAGPNSFVAEFSQAMVKLGKGESSAEPVKSQFGWHILKVDDIRDAQVPKLEEVKTQIQQSLAQRKLADFREQLKAKAKTNYKFN